MNMGATKLKGKSINCGDLYVLFVYLIIYLFIYATFNDVSNSSECMASNAAVIGG
jgi:hypothetical protein